ncbi:hypothetical protein GCM10027053_00480 [Intrasporangium mesophilum]
MKMPTTDTFERPPAGMAKDEPPMLFLHSYLAIRTAVGVIGILLPIVLALGDWFFVSAGIGAKGLPPVDRATNGWDLLHLRGSISAYYHTGVGDYFVAGLAVVGALLILYLSGQWGKWDFWLSLGAGIALLGVVFFPTARPGKSIPTGDFVPALACGDKPTPTDCSPIQTYFGETVTASIHFGCAVIFIGLLAAISFVFAKRMKTYEEKNKYRYVQTTCGWLIIAAIAWVAIGHWLNFDIAGLTPLYVGELLSVWAFGTSWLFKGLSLRALLSRRTPVVPPPEPTSHDPESAAPALH